MNCTANTLTEVFSSEDVHYDSPLLMGDGYVCLSATNEKFVLD
jgi:hypothetical protein